MSYSTITRRPMRLFELADQSWFPSYLRSAIQSILTHFWTHRLLFIQPRSPAELAADVVLSAVEDIERESGSEVVIVDFCSGGGGPVPAIERLVNARRKRRDGSRPLQFVLSDLHPHVTAWKAAAARSPNLGYVNASVDASAASQEDLAKVLVERSSASGGDKPRVFRLFCLAFHHFDDPLARKILLDAIENDDGFGIIELQSRTLSTMILMALYLPTILLVAPFWFRDHGFGLFFFIYMIPILPFALVFDGVVSALRSRTPDEILQLIYGRYAVFEHEGSRCSRYSYDEWVFEAGSQMHSWPVGYMEWFVGKKTRRML